MRIKHVNKLVQSGHDITTRSCTHFLLIGVQIAKPCYYPYPANAVLFLAPDVFPVCHPAILPPFPAHRPRFCAPIHKGSSALSDTE